jgi:hypothetical protein
MGIGNTMIMWSWVRLGMGMGSGLLYTGKTIPFSMVFMGMLVSGFWSCESVDMLFVGYTFVYNDVCSPSNAPPLPQK